MSRASKRDPSLGLTLAAVNRRRAEFGLPPEPEPRRVVSPSVPVPTELPPADVFAMQLDGAVSRGWIPEFKREVRFHDTRKWRFDFAWPAHSFAVEIDGGVWTQGRHVRGSGYSQDCLKFAEAALLDWRVIRCPSDWVRDGVALTLVRRWFAGRRP
jgi:hypothetical protein